MAVMVKGLKNGSLAVSGGVKVLDYKGKEYADAGDPVYLCRCGQSRNKPYCDGSHSRRLQVRRSSRLKNI